MSSGPFRQANADETFEVKRAGDGRLDVVRGDEIAPEPVRWAWYGWFAAGRLHILAGPPGLGKSSIMLALAATVTSGGRWPDGTRAHRGSVIILSYEDDPADTLVPRLIAMGADTKRVHIIRGVVEPDGRRGFNVAEDSVRLVDASSRIGDVRLIGIDPVIVALGAHDSHKNAEARRALQPVADLAAQTGAAVVGVAHFSKGTIGREPLERVSGSLAFGAAPRLVLGVAKVRDDAGEERRLFLRLKSNIGPDGGGFHYAVEPTTVSGGIETCRLMWGEAVAGSPHELLATEGAIAGECSELQDAKEFLSDELARGPVSSKQVYADAVDAGYSRATIRRAQKALGVKAEKPGMKEPWKWSLPPKMLNAGEDAQGQKVSTFSEDEHLQDADQPASDSPDVTEVEL